MEPQLLSPELKKSAQTEDRVEFRCMIQDILGNEIYSDVNEKLRDRTIFYCITIPGENDWVKKSTKNEIVVNNGINPAEIDRDSNRLSCSLINWSYPIPSDGKNRSCLIKVYDVNLVEFLRVNDIVHVNGILEPIEFEDDSQLMTNKRLPSVDENSDLDSDYEPARDFPHHLVPRIHVKSLRKLDHINPLLPEVFTRDTIDMIKVRMARARLSTILTQLFGGDNLAAEYLILSLISKIYRRKDVTTLGQLTIGLSGIKPEMKFLVDKIYEIISKITTHSHFIDMSIASLNSLRFTPKKDFQNNKMIAGTLQLPDGLYLMLNETALSEGQLTPQGTENLDALNQIIRWQRHKYNFNFHSVEIDTDLKILVVSEGKSLLSVPYDVRLKCDDSTTVDSMRQACDSVNDFMTEELLNKFRYYITALKEAPEYTIPDEMTKCIQEDFCTWRASESCNGSIFSASDLSEYITLARYLTISRGETSLNNELWKETCRMESLRRSRLLSR